MANLNESPPENCSRTRHGRALMILADPPPSYRLQDWYLKKITGVPFILLNMLNLQRGGIEDLTLYHPHLDAHTFEAFGKDPRLTLGFHRIADAEALEKAFKEGEFQWVLDGRVLYRKDQVRQILKDPDGAENVTRADWSDLASWVSGTPPVSGPAGENQKEGPHFMAGSDDQRVSTRKDFRIQSETLLQASGLSNDSPLDRLVTRKISRQLTRLFLLTPLSPNQITGIAMIMGLAGAACFWSGGYEAGVAGALLVLVSAWIDCTDGEVARLRFQESPLGGILDIWADNLVHAAAFFSMGMGLYFSTENGIYKILGTLAVFGSLTSFALLHSSVIESKKRAADDPAEGQEASLVDRMANRDFLYFLFALSLIDQLQIFLALTAVGSNVFALWLVFLKYRSAWSSSTDWCTKNSEKA